MWGIEIDAQLAALRESAPDGEQWLHEVKYDGYRMICRIDDGKAEFISRNHKDWTSRFRPLVQPVLELPVHQAILDGEVVVFKPNGVSDFQTLQNAFEMGRTPNRVPDLVNCVFDLLYVPARAATLPCHLRV